MRALTRLFQDFRPQGVVLGGGGGGGPDIPVTDLGTSVGPYLHQPGGQRIVVGNGSYDGQVGSLTGIRHDRDTSAPYKGWLILEAETPGGAILDLTDPGPGNAYRGGLQLVYPGVANGFQVLPLRIMLVGFHIINGLNDWQWLDYIRTWHCTVSNEVHQWDDQYKTAYDAKHGGDPFQYSTWDANLGMGNWTSSAIRCLFVTHREHYFTDFVDIGDDALFSSLGDVFLRGCRTDNIEHHNVNYLNPAEGYGLKHSDFVQTSGGTTIRARNCSFQGHGQFQTNAGSVTLDFDNYWQYGSPGIGMSFDESAGGGIVGTMKRGRWFANGQYNYTDFPFGTAPRYGGAGYDRMCYQDDHGRFYAGPAGLHWYDDGGTEIGALAFEAQNHIFPAGVSQNSSGILTPDYTAYPSPPWPNTTTVFDHDDNPAVIDREAAGHGPGDWESFFDPDATNNPAAGVYGWP